MAKGFQPAVGQFGNTTECLYSVVRNISDRTQFFGFLPPHGATLSPAEEYSFWGDIYERLVKLTPNERARGSMERALLQCVIEIVKGPAVHLQDLTNDAVTGILVLDSTNLAAEVPCWSCDQIRPSPSPSPSPSP